HRGAKRADRPRPPQRRNGTGFSQGLNIDDREQLIKLTTALKVSLTQLTRDECGDWQIKGLRGHIHVHGDGYLLVARARTARMWASIKERPRFCRVTQDGDDQGCMHLNRLPNKEEAATVRACLKLRKRRGYSPEELEAARARALIARGAIRKTNREAA